MDNDWSPDSSSFVMLAACRQDQLALEHSTQNNGLFTGVLLDTLESAQVDEKMTFEEVVRLVAAKLRPWQESVADGERKGSRLWFCEED